MENKDRFATLPELNVVYAEFDDQYEDVTVMVDGFDLLAMAEPKDRAAIQEFFTVTPSWFLQEEYL